MNPEVKAKWVAALRSGEYKQTTEVLQAGDAFCCLGVLCDLFAKQRGMGEKAQDFARTDEDTPNAEVAEWAGCGNPRLQINGDTAFASEHNDGWGSRARKNFIQIADAIQEQL